MFRSKKVAISPVQEPGVQQVPGSDVGKIRHIVDILRHGHGYFSKRITRYKSTVFRMNIGVKGIAVCDRKGAEVLFDLDKIHKEPKFGRLNYNLSLVADKTPSIFANGTQHELQKSFLMKLCQIAQKADVLDATNRIVPEYLARWQKADLKTKKAFEDDVMKLTSDIFSQAFLGIRVDTSCMHDMLYASWTKKKSVLRRGKRAAQTLVNEFKQSPKLTELLEIAKEMNLTEEQAVADILFMLNFNAYGGVSGSLRSSLARLHNTDKEFKQQLNQEIINSLNEDGITQENLNKMKLLERFIFENFRLSPAVPLLFGRANNDFTLHSKSGSFEVKQDELLIANVYMIQRDPSVFPNPDAFLPSRFEDESLLDHIVFTNGPFKEEATPKNHQCPGKDLILTVLKATLLHVILCCEYRFTKTPYWTAKRLRRIGCPDNMMELKEFTYTPKQDVIKPISLEVEDFG